MTLRLLNAYVGRTDQDDRDNYGKKRLDMCGSLLTQLFREKFLKYINTARSRISSNIIKELEKASGFESLDRLTDRIKNCFDSETITKEIRRALATGNWG